MLQYSSFQVPNRRMENDRLRQQAALMRLSLLDQGYLDEQFIELEQLQDMDPSFVVEEVISLFYRDSPKYITHIEQTLQGKPIDFKKLDSITNRFKGSSSSIGAAKVKNMITELMECCSARNEEGCRKVLEQVKIEYAALKGKLEAYYHLKRQAGPAETASRPK